MNLAQERRLERLYGGIAQDRITLGMVERTSRRNAQLIRIGFGVENGVSDNERRMARNILVRGNVNLDPPDPRAQYLERQRRYNQSEKGRRAGGAIGRRTWTKCRRAIVRTRRRGGRAAVRPEPARTALAARLRI